MSEEDNKLLKIYMKGWNDELDGVFNQQQKTKLFIRAYSVGGIDAIAGDECESIDLQTNNEIIANIREFNVC